MRVLTKEELIALSLAYGRQFADYEEVGGEEKCTNMVLEAIEDLTSDGLTWEEVSAKIEEAMLFSGLVSGIAPIDIRSGEGTFH